MKTTSFAAVLVLGAFAPVLAIAQTTAPANTMSASHARSAMTDFGCNGITQLGVAADGSYHGQCQKGGKTINVMMDASGKVSEPATVAHLTEGRARYALTAFGCSNISQLGNGPDGSWHGQCYKGGVATNVMVDKAGTATTATPTHVTEASARSTLTDYGCSGLTALNMAGNGGWMGQCTKGGKLMTVMVDRDSKVTTN